MAQREDGEGNLGQAAAERSGGGCPAERLLPCLDRREAFEAVFGQQPGEAFGKSYPLREVYPGTNQWGSYGWTCRSLDEARAKSKWIDREMAKILERGKTEAL